MGFNLLRGSSSFHRQNIQQVFWPLFENSIKIMLNTDPSINYDFYEWRLKLIENLTRIERREISNIFRF